MEISLSLSITNPIFNKGGLVPPPGYVFLVDDDGAYLLDDDGAYLMEPA